MVPGRILVYDAKAKPILVQVLFENKESKRWYDNLARGSTNFSLSTWFQGNSCRVFQFHEWTNLFIEQFLARKAWARKHEPRYQVMWSDYL